MGAIALVAHEPLLVIPGDLTTTEVTVRNDGTVVDQIVVEPFGDGGAWITPAPAEVHLLPGQDAQVTLHIRPPREPGVRPGPVSYAVRFRSTEDPDGSVVEEGELDVAAYAEVASELVPRTSHARGRRAGRHELAVDNRGNATSSARLTPVDPAEVLDFDVSPEVLSTAPGGASIAKLTVRAHKRMWRGQPITRPFQVLVDHGDEPPAVLEGSFLQEPVLPKWALKALLLLLVLAVVLAALWAGVVRPAVENVARAIAVDEVAAVKEDAAAAKQDAAVAKEDAAAAKKDAAAGGGAAQPPDGGAATGGEGVGSVTSGTPVTARLAATAGKQNPSVVLSQDQQVSLTDLLFQNPQGDTGTLTVSIGADVVYVTRLENFRDHGEHLIAPLQLAPGTALTASVKCENPPAPDGKKAAPCTPALTLAGFARAAG